MIQGLLFILKLIGWIILGILGIILGILLFVLFSAVRYRIDGKKEEKLEGEIRIAWLFGILSVVTAWKDGLQIKIKIFGKTVGQKNREPKTENKTYSETVSSAQNEREEKQKTPEKLLDEKERKESASGRTQAERIQNEYMPDDPMKEEAGSPGKINAGKTKSEKTKSEKTKAEKTKSPKGTPEKKKLNLSEMSAAVIQKLRCSFEKLCGKLRQIQEKWNALQEKWLWVQEKWLFITEYIQKPENQKSARLILRQTKKIFRHVLPRKGSSTITFGREDPYMMGKIVSYASAAYPFTHNLLAFHPVFGEDILEGEVHLRGHIRLGVILGYLLRFMFDKNIRRQLFGLLRKRKNR